MVENAAAFSLSGSNIDCVLGSPRGIWPAQVDAQQIGQAIHNLIINAAESMPGGGAVSIDFRNVIVDPSTATLAAGRYVEIAITDRGVGIPDENIEKIFDPYFSTKGKGEHKGTGLGLSISNSIISNHGGEITVSSRLGQGSTFHVRLPAADTAVVVEKAPLPHRDDAEPQTPIHGHGRILVMDDESMILELAGNLLRHLGYDADFAKTGQAAIEKYRAALDSGAPFDAVILDLTIRGGMGGQETIRELTAIDPDVRAIVSSGYSDNPVIANFRDYGFCERVAKPYEMAEFSRKLHRVVSGDCR